jgi:Icc-related predicted phosphoesterase
MAVEILIMVCGHCGNKTALEKKGEYSFKLFKYERKDDRVVDASETTRWYLLECLTCSKPTLMQEGHLDLPGEGIFFFQQLKHT